MKVLVVDDSATMRRILINLLAQMGLTEILEAANGSQAVALAGDGEIGLVLMDWNMPEMSGVEALRAIRAAGHKMPVIMITTEGERERVIEAIRSGASNYIIKPFKAEVATAKIREVLEAHKTAGA